MTCGGHASGRVTAMTETLHPKLETLPAEQRAIWPRLSEVPDHFTLYGGTAIALHLGHRTSVDFDFFADRHFDPDALQRDVPLLRGVPPIQKSASTLTCLVGAQDSPVKISFFGVPARRHGGGPDEASVAADEASDIVLSDRARHPVKPIPETEETIRLAKRSVWYKDPVQALRQPMHLAAHVMAHGTPEDVQVLERHIGRDGMAETLRAAPPGILDERSWWYWHLILFHRSPPPPMPIRTFGP